MVIPCYRVRDQVGAVVRGALEHADRVYCVDDACPESSGDLVEAEFGDDSRVSVIRNQRNLGVGGAVKAGYRAALAEGCDLVVKLDGDGQLAPELMPAFLAPLQRQRADYCKGNRFWELDYLKSTPLLRLFGNSVLSLMSKFSSGYWRTLDPTNGYTAIHANALRALPLDKISDGYFFESDMLFRLNVARAVVVDVPMRARYADEKSSLNIARVILPFLAGHTRNFIKRIFYTYFLRDFNVASLQLLTGAALGAFGLVFGLQAWGQSVASDVPASAGTVMLAGLPLLLGVQLLLSFLNYDIQNAPSQPLSAFGTLPPPG